MKTSKKVSPYFWAFVGTAVALAFAAKIFMTMSLNAGSSLFTFLTAGLYAAGMFAAGWYWGRKDTEYLPVYNVGFRYHLATYIVHNGAFELWALLGLNNAYDPPRMTHYVAAAWGVVLVVHFILYLGARKKAIDNLDSSELFE